MTSSTVYKRISHILLISPFICPFLLSFQEIKVGMAYDGYRRGVCELCSLFAIFTYNIYTCFQTVSVVKGAPTNGNVLSDIKVSKDL